MATAADIESVLMSRHQGRETGPTITFSCANPSHEDRHPSASWHRAKKAFKCHACGFGGGMLVLAKALGLDDGEVEYPGKHMQNSRSAREGAHDWKTTETYDYELADGRVFKKMRQESASARAKQFRWEPKPSEAGVTMGDMPLFGRETIRAGAPVLFVEGEGTAKACHARGLAAVTGAGGSSQKDFGEGLRVLHNHDVWLWADNDEEGHVLMSLLNAQLKPLAKALHVVAVPLPHHGDAADYFRGGGTVEAIWASDSTKPAYDVIHSDRILAKVPSEQGTVLFDFADLLHSPRALDAEVTISVNGFGDEYHWSGNVLSSSGRSALGRDLRSFYAGQADLNWSRAVNTAFHGAISAHTSIDPSVEAFTLNDPGDPGYLIPPLLPRDQPTVWFSMGGVAKTYLAITASVITATGGVWPGHQWADYIHDRGNVLYLDYETCADGGATFRRRIQRVAKGMGRDFVGGVRYWPGKGIPLHDQIEAIGKAIREHDIRLFVIDSALGACGGAPEDSSTVQRFFSDLGKLPPVTVLIISHIVKPRRDKDGNVVPEASEYPFGSIHWHNQARATWYLEGSSQGPNAKGLTFMNRKANDGPTPRDQRYVLSFEDWTGPVKLETQYDWSQHHGNGYSTPFPGTN